MRSVLPEAQDQTIKQFPGSVHASWKPFCRYAGVPLLDLVGLLRFPDTTLSRQGIDTSVAAKPHRCTFESARTFWT